METSLPDLPFPNYGQAVLGPFHSATRTAPREYPRTDLASLEMWTSFPNDIHQAIQSATNRASLSPAPFSVGNSSTNRIVTTVEKIRTHATIELHERVERVVNMLGVVGSFYEAGGGNASIIGDPDFSWLMGGLQPHPKLVVRVSTTSLYEYFI